MNDFGIEVDTAPYIAVRIDRDRWPEVMGRPIQIYEIEGRKVFDIKDKKGNPTGDMVFFVVFK